jgi:hypothetical protein
MNEMPYGSAYLARTFTEYIKDITAVAIWAVKTIQSEELMSYDRPTDLIWSTAFLLRSTK